MESATDTTARPEATMIGTANGSGRGESFSRSFGKLNSHRLFLSPNHGGAVCPQRDSCLSQKLTWSFSFELDEIPQVPGDVRTGTQRSVVFLAIY
jgi:hypothetical protein